LNGRQFVKRRKHEISVSGIKLGVEVSVMEDDQKEAGRPQPPKERAGARLLSRLAVLLALALLLCTCHICLPGAERRLRALAAGAKDSPAAQAFSSLTRALGEGEGAVQAFSESYGVLKGAAD
jgi:hypothetical protein